MISGASDEELDIAIARANVLLELQPKIDELKKENKELKQQLEQRDNIINKVREHIEEDSLEVNTKEYGAITVVNSNDLLEILNIDKGDE